MNKNKIIGYSLLVIVALSISLSVLKIPLTLIQCLVFQGLKFIIAFFAALELIIE